jgi:hypothetical protein
LRASAPRAQSKQQLPARHRHIACQRQKSSACGRSNASLQATASCSAVCCAFALRLRRQRQQRSGARALRCMRISRVHPHAPCSRARSGAAQVALAVLMYSTARGGGA